MQTLRILSVATVMSASIACSGGGDSFVTAPGESPDTGTTTIVDDTGSPVTDTGSPNADTGVAATDTAVVEDTSAPPFSPKDLDGLVLWLDAAKGLDMSGVDVSTWRDQSSKGNDVSQSDVAKRPKTATFAGMPAVAFTPGLFLVRAADQSKDLDIGKGDATLAVVARDTGTEKTSLGIVFQKCNQSTAPFAGLLAFINMDGAQKWAGGTAGAAELLKTATSLPTDKPHTLVYQRSGGQMVLRIDGIEANKTALGTVVDATSNDPLFIGNRADGKHPASSNVFEVVVVHGTVDAERTSKLESYLLAKYGK